MATYLVTGAAGFIGAEVCKLLLAGGNTVVGIDNLNDYYDIRLKDYRLGMLLNDECWKNNRSSRNSAFVNQGRRSDQSGRFIFETVDIEDLTALDRLFSEFTFNGVLNLAARAGVRYSLVNPHVYLSTNTQGVLNLLECLRKHAVRKFVQASTSSLYAGCPMPFLEEQPVNMPLSPYAASKKAAELMAYSYHHLYGIDTTVLRYFTVFGPAGRPDMAPFRFVHWIACGKPIKLFGDGSQTRDFTYVTDIARGTVLALKEVGYEIVNLGGGNRPISINKMITLLEKQLGCHAVIDQRPANPVDMVDTQADIHKARELLGWVPLVSPEEGFELMTQWYTQHREMLSAIAVGT